MKYEGPVFESELEKNDVVEVVYCRDCIHRADIEEANCGVCEIVHRYRKGNDYCSYGERREK